jgi:hypothetical protein
LTGARPRFALATLGVLAGCTFPGVIFDHAADGGGSFLPDTNVAAPDASSDDAGDATVTDGPGPPADASDAGPAVGLDGGCDFNGTWASRITINVSWTPQGLNNFILAAGSGQIVQWVKGVRTQQGTALTDSSVICGVSLPDFQSAGIAGLAGEVYGVRFPDSLFDNKGYLPGFTVNGAVTPLQGGGLGYSSTTTAALLGLTMADPINDPWPAMVTMGQAADQDQDGKPGVTVSVAQGPLAKPVGGATAYSYVPTDIPPVLLEPPVRASALYLAIRQLTVVSGKVQDCDTITGTVQIPLIKTAAGDMKYAIDSHILGCALVDGGDCTTSTSSSQASQASFVDNSQPVFTPTGTTIFQSIRLKDGATCADVRTAPYR